MHYRVKSHIELPYMVSIYCTNAIGNVLQLHEIANKLISHSTGEMLINYIDNLFV